MYILVGLPTGGHDRDTPALRRRQHRAHPGHTLTHSHTHTLTQSHNHTLTLTHSREREFFIDNLLLRIHFII